MFEQSSQIKMLSLSTSSYIQPYHRPMRSESYPKCPGHDSRKQTVSLIIDEQGVDVTVPRYIRYTHYSVDNVEKPITSETYAMESGNIICASDCLWRDRKTANSSCVSLLREASMELDGISDPRVTFTFWSRHQLGTGTTYVCFRLFLSQNQFRVR